MCMEQKRLCISPPPGPYPKCPICGIELLPKVDDRGMYWRCIKCNKDY